MYMDIVVAAIESIVWPFNLQDQLAYNIQLIAPTFEHYMYHESNSGTIPW